MICYTLYTYNFSFNDILNTLSLFPQAFGDTMSLFTNDEGQIECPDIGGTCSEDAVRVPALLPDCLHNTRKGNIYIFIFVHL